MTRLRDPDRGEVLIFKELQWQTVKIEARSTLDQGLSPLRLITNQSHCRIVIKKKTNGEISRSSVCRVILVELHYLNLMFLPCLKQLLSFVYLLITLTVLKCLVTPTQRTARARKESFILASALSFAGCAAFIAHSSSTLGLRYLFVVIRCVHRTFCACSKLCAELGAWVHTPEGRQTRAERAGPTPDTRRTLAGYSLYVRRLRCSEHPAHTWRTSSARVANMYRLYVCRHDERAYSAHSVLTCAMKVGRTTTHWRFCNAPAVHHVGVTKLASSCEILMKVGHTTTHWRFAMRRPCVM